MSNFRLVYEQENGTLAVVIPAPGVSVEEAAKAVPQGKSYKVVSEDSLPTDRVFRTAWKLEGDEVVEDQEKSLELSHKYRRLLREQEFMPLDDKIAKRLPGWESVETDRQKIRDKYAEIQTELENATSVEEYKNLLGI